VVALYETVLVEDGRVRLADRHLARLARSGAGAAAVAAAAAALAEACATAAEPTVVRLDVAPDGSVTPVPRRPRPASAVRLLPVAGFDPARAARERKEADRSWADGPESAARAAGFDEPLLVSPDGLVGETTRANLVAILEDGTLATPPARGLLPGVTRSWALEQLPIAERELALLELLDARAAFLTTAGRGIVRVAAVGGTELGDDPRIEALQAAWRAL
jgi:branched-chain amino acid aminotransferase